MKIEKELLPVFVYGTLKFGYSNSDFLRTSIPIGKATTKKNHALYVDGYNGLPYLKKEPKCKISGEVYQVNPLKLMQLDSLEGHPDYYKREKIEVIIGKKIVSCWTYFYTGSVFRCDELTNGEYVQPIKYQLW